MNVNTIIATTVTVFIPQISDYPSIGSVVYAIGYSIHQMPIKNRTNFSAACTFSGVEFDFYAILDPFKTGRRIH